MDMNNKFIDKDGNFNTTDYINSLIKENLTLKNKLEKYENIKNYKNNYYRNKYKNDPVYRQKKLEENRRQYLLRKEKNNNTYINNNGIQV
tara:strand:- start:375 stop:644 length:270 start_codon:yes stop_codon:yes gene_type:complete